jgi:glucosyl-3-phosphoglycerate synthase
MAAIKHQLGPVALLRRSVRTPSSPLDRPGRATTGALAVLEAKGGRTIAACIPARDEAATIDPIVAECGRLRGLAVLDQVIVVDDHSRDATADKARRAGATVVTNPGDPGKGQALRRAVAHADADVLVFLDADVANFTDRFVCDLALPLLLDPALQLVKPAYRRPLDGRPGEGGRVTELVARPLLERYVPDLATVAQPLGGECAVRRTALDGLLLADGYGIEIGLLIDVYRRFGRSAIAEVDLGERIHRNRPLSQLGSHARAVLDAVMVRVGEIEPMTPDRAGGATATAGRWWNGSPLG